MAGLTWLATRAGGTGSWISCLVFVRGSDVDKVLRDFGAGPGKPVAAPQDGSPFPEVQGEWQILGCRVGDWVMIVDPTFGPGPAGGFRPQGLRPEVLRRISAGTEAVALYNDIGKGNDEFIHAYDGEIITGVMDSIPPRWYGTQPDRLRSLAEEISAQLDSTGIEDYLALMEGVFGISLDQESPDRSWSAAEVLPVLDDLPPEPPAQRHPRTGDVELDLRIDQVTDEARRHALARRLERLMRRGGIAASPQLADAVHSVLAGNLPPVDDDSPLGVALRTAVLDHPKAVNVLRLALAGRTRAALVADASQHEKDRVAGWREEIVADLGNPRISPDDLHAAEDSERERLEAAGLSGGAVDPAPVRAHIEALLNAGMNRDALCLRGGLPLVTFDRIINGRQIAIAGTTAKRLLSLKIPSSGD